MTTTGLPPHEVAELGLAPDGADRVAWARDQMPVLRAVRERFARDRPLSGVRVGACLHVTPETANLMLTLLAGGAQAALCSANPLSAQDDVAATLVADHHVEVHARRGEDLAAYAAHVRAVLDTRPQITIDDGADLLMTAHELGSAAIEPLIGGVEETTTGLVRLRRLHERGALRRPVIAANEARTERALNDRHGTGQSALDGIVRASNVLLAGHTVVVCEIDPLRALEARMSGYEVMPALAAAPRGDIFITVTGSRRVLRGEHFQRMKDGALLANAGHFDVELDLEELRSLATGDVRRVRPLVDQYELADGRRLNLLAGGRVVNLAAAEGHPAAVMDVSFALQALCVEDLVRRGTQLAPGVHPVPHAIDTEVGRLKLDALGVQIDQPTAEQSTYRESWA